VGGVTEMARYRSEQFTSGAASNRQHHLDGSRGTRAMRPLKQKKGRHPQRSRPEKFETSGVAAKHLRGERLERTRLREETAAPVPNNRDCYVSRQMPFCNAALASLCHASGA
jgi:hypothetical protein